jgi:RNA polymerase sigma factor (sigma-70 family)
MITLTDSPDADLLERFLESRDERAFEALVERHGPLVAGVCSRVLGNRSDADDATQAVFLTLARKAASLRHTPCLAPWLHYVARCTARNARTAALARSHHETISRRSATAQGPEEGLEDPQDLRLRLDAALESLPERYRSPLILFHLEGRSLAETARSLDSPVGTIGARLSRGRELLRAHLSRSKPPVGSAQVEAVLSASAPLALLTPIPIAQVVCGGSVSPAISALSYGVLHMLHLAKIKIVVLCLLLASVLIGGSGVLVARAHAETARAQAAAEVEKTRADAILVEANARQAAAVDADATRELRARISQLERENAGAVSFSDLERCGVLDISHEAEDTSFIFDAHGHLSDQAKTFFHLTPQEQAMLQAVLSESYVELAARLRAAGAHRQQQGDAVVVSLPALGASGEQLHAAMQQRFTDLLGAARGTLCAHILGRYWDDAYLGFGVHEQSLHCRRLNAEWMECSHHNEHGSWTRQYKTPPWKYSLFAAYLTPRDLDAGVSAPAAATPAKPAGGF